MTIRLIPHVHQSDPDNKLIALTDATSITGAGFTLANGEIRTNKDALSFDALNDVVVVASADGKSSRTFQVRVIPSVVQAVPVITAPATLLTSASATFQWNANGAPVAEWRLYVGSTAGGFEYLDTGSIGTSTSRTVSNLPTNGAAVHVTIFYRVTDSTAWLSVQRTFTAHTVVVTNTPPVLNLAATATITAGETTIAALSVTDPDQNQTITYELTSNPGNVAQIVSNTLRFVAASAVGSYTLSVRASDQVAYSAVKTITVTVQAAAIFPASQTVTPFAALTSVSMAAPALRVPTADAKYAGTNLIRISDPSEIKPASGTFNNFGPFYATRQHWNSNDTRVIVTGYNTGSDGNYAPPYDRNYHLFDAATFAHLGPIVTAGGVGLTNHWRWSNTDPNELLFVEFDGTALKAFNISTMTISTVKDFAGTYDKLSDDFCGGVGDPSNDGRYWALGLRKPGGAWFVVCWDRQTDTVLSEIPVPIEPGTDYLAQANMSPSGNLVCIWGKQAWTSGATPVARGLSVWSRNGAYQWSINETGGGVSDIVGDHNAVCTDADGNDAVVYLLSPDGIARGFVSRRIDQAQSGAAITQVPDGILFGAHYAVPMAFAKNGWVVVSDYPSVVNNASFNARPMRSHVWAFKLDGSQTIYPICEARFSHTDYTLPFNYLQFPWATPNRNLTQVMFKSSFDTDWSAGSGGVPTTFHAMIAMAS